MNSVTDWTSVQALRGVQAEQDFRGINLAEEQMRRDSELVKIWMLNMIFSDTEVFIRDYLTLK